MKISQFRHISRFDLLCSAVAALREGVAPLYNLYLVSSLGFTPIEIGWVLASMGAAQLAAQIPMGYLYDKLDHKGLPIAASAILMFIASATMGFADKPSFQLTIFAQILFGIGLSGLMLGIPALTVATTEEDQLGGRLARNEAFGKTANFATLGIVTLLTYVQSLKSIFLVWGLIAIPVFGLSLFMPKGQKARWQFRWPRPAMRAAGSLPWFVLVVFLLYFANTGALTIFEQAFAPTHFDNGAPWISAATVVSQLFVAITIYMLARVKTTRGLVTVLGLTFAVIATRLGVLSTGGVVPVLLLGQMLDGMVDGVLFTVPARILAEQRRDDFNILQGVLGSTAALGSLASTFATGPLVFRYEYPRALFAFWIPAALGVLVTLYARKTLVGIKETWASMAVTSVRRWFS